MFQFSCFKSYRFLLRWPNCRPLADHSDRTYVHQSLSPRRQHTQPTYFWSKRPSLNSLNTLKRCSLAVSKSGLTKVKQQDYVSLDKRAPSYFVEGIWQVKLAATIMQLELLYTPSQKYLWQKSNIFPWKELNWNWCTQHREDWQNPLAHVMVENQSTKEGRVHSFTEENLPVKKFCCC